jgi:hypothetical protein
MRKCCCCISVHIGAAILGFIGLTICLLELVVIIPYLLQVDKDVFNPIEHNLNDIFFIFEETLESNNFEKERVDEIVTDVQNYLWPTFLGAGVEAGVYGLCCLLLMIGASCQVRGLMVPYLILQMLAVIILILVGVAVTVGLFMLNVIMGVVAGTVVLVISVLLIYFWAAVQRAYTELGNNDYMYSPAPIKPIYNTNNEARVGGYYPTSPQHFQMEEHK